MTYAGHMAFQVIRNRNSKGAGFPSLQTAGFVTVNTIVIFFWKFLENKIFEKKILEKKILEKNNVRKKMFEKKSLKKKS